MTKVTMLVAVTTFILNHYCYETIIFNNFLFIYRKKICTTLKPHFAKFKNAEFRFAKYSKPVFLQLYCVLCRSRVAIFGKKWWMVKDTKLLKKVPAKNQERANSNAEI